MHWIWTLVGHTFIESADALSKIIMGRQLVNMEVKVTSSQARPNEIFMALPCPNYKRGRATRRTVE